MTLVEDHDLNPLDFVNVSVENLTPIVPGIDPEKYDPISVGTPLARGWVAQHAPKSANDDVLALKHLVLINTRSGQRVQLNFTRNVPPLTTIHCEPADPIDYEKTFAF